MTVFQVSLNFNPAKETLKLRCQIYILMTKLIFLRKLQAAMKAFTPPFSTISVWAWTEKKACENEIQEK